MLITQSNCFCNLGVLLDSHLTIESISVTCKKIFFNLHPIVHKPKRVQNATAHLTTGTRRREPITPLELKIAVLVFKHHKIYSASDESLLPLTIIFFPTALKGLNAPVYLFEYIAPYFSSHDLRSN